MADFEQILLQLTDNLHILRQREAGHGGRAHAPIELINQMADHERAIELTEQAKRFEITEAEWREKLRPLRVDVHLPGEAGPGGAGQTAIGQGIAQAGPGGTAIVNYYHPAAPADERPTLAAARELLAQMPTETVPAVAPLPPGSRMPYPANPLFVGRQTDLVTLAQALKAGGTAAIGQVAAATGLGGIGKSQLAAEFAHRYGQYFAGGVFWLSLAEAANAPAEVAACGRRAGLNLAPDFDRLDLPDQVALVQAAWREPMPRLLIFDNCEDEALLAGWRPVTGGSRVVVTSRRANWEPALGVKELPLGVLPRPQSIELLRKFRPNLAPLPTSPRRGEEQLTFPPAGGIESETAPERRCVPKEQLTFPPAGGIEGEPAHALNAIAKELGDLPLALHLAGSFLARYPRVTPADYLAQLRAANPLAHPALQGRGAAHSPTGHELHVAKTFALSYNALSPADPAGALARQLLARAACFAPGEPIPADLLLATVEVEAKAEPPAQSSIVNRKSKIDLDDALRRLTDLGLLTAAGGEAVALHRLLAAFVEQTNPDPAAPPAVERAVLDEARRLNAAGVPGPLLAWQPHLRHLTEMAAPRGDEMGTDLCNSMGYHLDMVGDYAAARPYYERALAICEQVLGPAHPDTAASLNNLGGLLDSLGDYEAARPTYERALAINEQALGPAHPNTAGSLNNLGMLLKSLGDYAAARPYLERALAIREQVLGPAHPNTAGSLNNLGFLLKSLGDYAAARPYFERALAICEQVLGPAHPDTATSLNNLGLLLKSLGDYAAARPYYERALAICEQVLGPAHPNTQIVRGNLQVILAKLKNAP